MSRQNIRAHDVIDLYLGSAYGCALILVELARVATNAGYKQWASELLGQAESLLPFCEQPEEQAGPGWPPV